MLHEKIFLACFIKKEKTDKFINFIYKKYGVPREKVFIYSVDRNDEEYLLSFKFSKYERFEQHKEFGKPIHVHLKNRCLFSINALNKYIEENAENIDKGNFDYKQFELNWDLLKDKMLIIKNDLLEIVKLTKIENVYNTIYNKKDNVV